MLSLLYYRHIAENYIAKDGVEQKTKTPIKRNIVRCRLGTSQDQGKPLRLRTSESEVYQELFYKIEVARKTVSFYALLNMQQFKRLSGFSSLVSK